MATKGLGLAIVSLAFCAVAGAAPHQSNDQPRICFFSLNNDREVASTRYFFKHAQLGPAGERIEVQEYLPYAKYASEAFQKFLAGGPRCDGLVLSGHHRNQGFEGERTAGYLPTEKLEQLSCSVAYQNWFKNVKALWLQGCATSSRPGDAVDTKVQRYSRIFPNATIFAWSGSAPSKRAPITIPLQMANFTKLLERKLGRKVGYSEAGRLLLSGEYSGAARESWLAMRRVKSGDLEGIFNGSAQAFAPLLRHPDMSTELASVCRLQQNTTAAERLEAITQLISREATMEANARLLLRELTVAEQKYPEYAQILRHQLRHQNQLPKVVGRLVWKHDISLEARLQLYHLYLESGLKRQAAWERYLLDTAVRGLNRSRQAWDRVERKHYRWQIIRQLVRAVDSGRQPLLEPAVLRKIHNPEALLDVLKVLAEKSPANTGVLLEVLAQHPFASGEVLYQTALLARLKRPANLSILLENILKNPKVTAKTRSLIPAPQG